MKSIGMRSSVIPAKAGIHSISIMDPGSSLRFGRDDRKYYS
jgi:hypothetical protein